MKNNYEKEILVASTYADRRCELGIYQGAMLIQDAMTEFFYQHRCDSVSLSKSHQAVWAVARTKILFSRDIFWMDQVRLKVFPVKISSVAVHLNVLLETLDGEPLFRARQELCVIDVVSHSLRRIESTPFPMDMELLPPVLTTPCLRMKMKLGPEHFVCDHRVRTMDTDMNQHMNNANYIRLLLNARPSEFWDTYRVQEFDIQYVNEAVEGEDIQVYCQETEQELAVQIKRGETTLVKALLQLTRRDGQA